MEQEQAKFEGWAIVEMMGHQKEIGYVTTEAYGVAVLFRVDVPDMPAHEFILKRPEWGKDGEDSERVLPVGTKVQRAGSSARSRLVSPAAVYAINPCSEEAAKAALQASTHRPLICINLPANKQLTLQPGQPSEADDAPEADQLPEERCCKECGQTREEGHSDGCSFAQDDDEAI
jgi:hypothetical protein